MRNLEFDATAFEDLAWWVEKDRKTALRIMKLIQEVQRNPFQGIGKPEKLKHDLSGCWSRRIDSEHRLVYQVKNSKIDEKDIFLDTESATFWVRNLENNIQFAYINPTYRNYYNILKIFSILTFTNKYVIMGLVVTATFFYLSMRGKFMSNKTTYIQGSQFGGGFAEGDYKGDVTHNYASDKNLAEAAKEIQQLLDQLSKTYPTNSTHEKITIATKALEEIQKNPNLVQRILGAFKAGSSAALEQSLNHPAASFLINFIQDLQETQDKNVDL